MRVALCRIKKGCIELNAEDEIIGDNISLIEINNEEWSNLKRQIKKKK